MSILQHKYYNTGEHIVTFHESWIILALSANLIFWLYYLQIMLN